MSKLITDELINERLEAKGFGDEQSCDDEVAKENVLKHYGVELTDNMFSIGLNYGSILWESGEDIKGWDLYGNCID